MSDNREHVPERNKLGNMAAMRETLETVRKYVKETTPDKVMLGVIEVWCDEALAKPPRNCDVGTAEEQSRRLAGFCKSHGLVDGISRCEKCRFLGDDNCELMWAQMPYEENESEAKG